MRRLQERRPKDRHTLALRFVLQGKNYLYFFSLDKERQLWKDRIIAAGGKIL